MVEDIIKALRMFDGKEPVMGKAWLTINNLKKQIFRLQNLPFLLILAVAKEIEENFMKRWNLMLTNLNPYLRGLAELQHNGEAKHALNRVFRR